ncbi:Fe(3+) ABC transporter substrate-binding protein [Campylobacter hepaticus]|uniref:Fe(3+) ABC transporter substrate-binding protein n=1 Tax=Campylobacter hepaticus TaxID=1813019 RepID=UPI0018C9E993|nr:Fe(3+) ABC transporter substrate-binding protein [Campylobacter hepaticus]MCZ0771589.1 Fe(3+) ABC transporter substrate-binding protein [Campylobacter hepaticus]MCZ0773057.1 Fe(3+) ABC transporter substrate-binding protein [Campylobacter hepaticus]MCZ0775737.1 Fe(3+) ABC transporter substrate-binding protein [Campylobacter hepaticus]QPM43575.1 Fe(3+) ABC transporter substrate-binding protein [Campylobacter hepaticus]WAP49599.1 Fe(3+) ABC transporter substrate-binding protein [Campylobacter 
MKKIFSTFLLSISLLSATELNIYSARHYDADFQIIKKFEEKTGIKVNHTQAKASELIKRLSLEGTNSPADIFITADISNLAEAKNSGILAPVKSEYLEKTIPQHLRDKDKQWFAITKRARIIAYNKNANTDISKMKNYEDLAKPEFKGQIVMRSATAPYSKTLLASIIVNDGDKNAKAWAKGLLDNLATNPKGGDRDQARQVFAGEAKFAVMNTYYIGLLKNSKNPKDVEVGNSLGIIFPNQDNRGTHINISGIAMTKSSKNQEAAKQFMEFMLSPEIQKILTDTNYEFPIRNDIELSQTVKDFGNFKEDQIPVSEIAENIKEAIKIYDQIGFR